MDVESVDLEDVWRRHASRRVSQPALEVRLRMDAGLAGIWRDRYRMSTIEQDGDTATIVCHFDYIVDARTAVLPWGGAVEVLSPPALRLSVADFAAQIVAVYADR